MRILYIDAFSGVSGDKLAATLLDIYDDHKKFHTYINSLNISNEVDIEINEKDVMGINSKKFNVIEKTHSHHHRHLSDIEKIIDDSNIPVNAKKDAKGIFKILGEAEAKVHNVSIDKIHFHEVGAVDSIIDIVSSAILINELNIDEVWSSNIPTGCGFINAAHGTLPVPAPATNQILKDIPIYGTEIKTELTTPTGAAVIKYYVKKFTGLPAMKIIKTGYGAGTKDLEIPNYLRIHLGEIKEETAESETVVSLETNLDDCSPEQIAFLCEKLLKLKALDVYITPIIMKKGRPAQLLTVLCSEKDRNTLEEEIFKNSTTFGIRRRYHQRTCLKREFKTINVLNHEIKLKIGYLKGKPIQTSVEYETAKTLIEKTGLSYNEVIEEINKSVCKNN